MLQPSRWAAGHLGGMISAEQLKARLERMLARRAGGDADAALRRAGLAVAFVHEDPELILLLDGRGAEVVARWDTLEPPPDLIFEMGGAAIDRFWSGELNVMRALSGGELRARGNLLRGLALLPGLPETQAAYRAALAEEEETNL